MIKLKPILIRRLFQALFIGMGFGINSASAENVQTVDDLGFNTVINDRLFSSDLKIQGSNTINIGGNRTVLQSNLEIQSDSLLSHSYSLVSPIEDNVVSEYQSSGLKIKRLSASWKSGDGALTVGNNWADFQDILGFDEASGKTDKSISSQIRWLSPNGFSIALEDPIESDYLSSPNIIGEKFEQSPSIVLSWQSEGTESTAGEYRISAMGTKIDPQSSGQKFSADDKLGWGIKLEGGWQIGDLFAALSVTYGKGINSYILRRFGNELLVTPNEVTDSADAFSIRPSLYYSLNEHSNFHVALGSYSADDSLGSQSFDTLDTIHMGYTWNPWPNTHFGLEVVGQNTDGTNGKTEKTRVKFGARKLF